MGWDIIQVAPDITEIDRQINLRRRAGGVNGSENIKYGAAVPGLSKFRCHQGANFGAQATLPAIVGELESWVENVLGQFRKILDDIVGGTSELGLFRPGNKRWRAIWLGSCRWSFTCYRSEAAVFECLPNPQGIFSSEFQSSLVSATHAIDPSLDASEQCKATQHVIAKIRVVVSIPPERPSCMRTAARQNYLNHHAELRIWQIVGRKITLKDQWSHLWGSEFKDLGQDIADEAEVSPKQTNHTAFIFWVRAPHQQRDVEALYVTFFIFAGSPKSEAVVESLQHRLDLSRLLTLFAMRRRCVYHVGWGVVAGGDFYASHLLGKHNKDGQKIVSKIGQNSADFPCRKAFLANHERQAIDGDAKANRHFDYGVDKIPCHLEIWRAFFDCGSAIELTSINVGQCLNFIDDISHGQFQIEAFRIVEGDMKPFAMMREFAAIDLEILGLIRRFNGDRRRKVSFVGLFEFRRG